MKHEIRFLALTAILGAGAVHADTLFLRDGRTVTGNYSGGNDREVRFQVNGRNESYDLSNVRRIEFDRNTASSSYDLGRRDRDSRESYDRDRARGGADRYRTGERGTIPDGAVVTVRMIDGINSDRNSVGQTFRASVDEPVVVDGRTLIPAGSDATVRIVDVQQGGRITGKEEVSVELASVAVNGREIPMNSGYAEVASKARGSQSAKVIGGTAVVGAIIGAIAGGGKGAAIGAASGAGAGTAIQAIRGQRVEIPSESRLDFRINRAVRID